MKNQLTYLFLLFLVNGGWTTIMLGQQAGGTQPEFSKFTPVSTSNLVNQFTGDFQYNIPIINIPGDRGSGYALSLSYDQNMIGPNQDVSWVGMGWTLNPGAIIHQINGFSDDAFDTEIIYWNKDRENFTFKGAITTELEVLGLNPLKLGIETGKEFIYNSKSGFHFGNKISLSGIQGVDFGYKYVSQGNDYSLFFDLNFNKQFKLNDEVFNKEIAKIGLADIKSSINLNTSLTEGSQYLFYGDKLRLYPTNIPSLEGGSFNLGINLSTRPSPGPFGASIGHGLYFSNTKPIAKETISAYGFLYSGHAAENDTAAMDYISERSVPFHVNNPYLPIPHMAKDDYIVTGEGAVGNLKLHSRTIGTVRPSKKTNSIQPGGNLTVGIRAGANWGIKGAGGLSFSSQTIEGWDVLSSPSHKFTTKGIDENAYFFRFNGDLGGNYINGTLLDTAGAAYMLAGMDAGLPLSHFSGFNNYDAKTGRSSSIIYHTNEEMALSFNGIHYKAITKDSIVNGQQINRDEPAIQHHIGEISILNENGQRYTYGLPVYAKNNYNLQYSLEELDRTAGLHNHILAYLNSGKRPEDSEVVKGVERPAPEPVSYLLTLITTPDYRDLTNDGPTEDDMGGYTRFIYKQKHGSQNKAEQTSWYNFRSPFRGLFFEGGQLSDANDDMGMISGGEKEIYYLEKIETRTHYAQFIRSSRLDGIEAPQRDNSVYDNDATGIRTLEKLDQVKIYAKGKQGQADKLIETINFKYDYSLMRGTPDNPTGEGKLTLKGIWTEHDSTYNHKVAPTLFSYKYPKSNEYAPAVQNKYPEITQFGYLLDTLEQNPTYNIDQVDRWGRYQESISNKASQQNFWVNQSPNLSSFDPAAWQLKQITLPTGAKVQVQYEQDDYAYIEDKKAHAMMSMDPSVTSSTTKGVNTFYLKISDFGFNNNNVDHRQLFVEMITKEYIQKNAQMYYDIHYVLQDYSTDACKQERIQGYGKVTAVGEDQNGIYITLGSKTNYELQTPYEACIDYIEHYKIGKLNTGGTCSPDDPIKKAKHSDGEAIGRAILGLLAGPVAQMVQNDWIDNHCCLKIEPSKSYLRIPVPAAKKGGGLRVKRLLTYDAGVTAKDAVLYGTEYIYECKDPDRPLEAQWISSGVAVNEPSKGRSENILVQPLTNKLGLSEIESFLFPDNRIKREGPLGEAFRPAASVGYSQIITRGIHEGPSNTGYTISNYHTAREHPIVVKTTTIDKRNIALPSIGASSSLKTKGKKTANKNKTNDVSWTIGASLEFEEIAATQGYLFIFNDMHGKPQHTAQYAYQYNASETKPWRQKRVPYSSQEFHYLFPHKGDSIPIMAKWGKIDTNLLGVENDYTIETKSITNENNGGTLGLDFGASSGLPLFFMGISLTGHHSQSKVKTNIANKIVRYRSFLKETRLKSRGIESSQSILAYDPFTGKALVATSPDEYDGLILNGQKHNGFFTTYSLPASHKYQALGQASENQGAIIRPGQELDSIQIEFDSEYNLYYLKLTASEAVECERLKNTMMAGDLIAIHNYSSNNLIGLFHISDYSRGNRIYLHQAVNINNANGGSISVNPGDLINAEIILSGRTNELNTTIATLTTYGEVDEAKNQQFMPLDPQQYSLRSDITDKLNDELNNLKNHGPGSTNFIPVDPIMQRNELFNSCTFGPANSIRNLSFTTKPGYPRDIQLGVSSLECYKTLKDYQNIDRFELDAEGNIVYFEIGADCNPILAMPDCFKFCPSNQILLDNVIKAEAITLKDNWPYNDSIFSAQHTQVAGNVYEKGEKGNWRTHKQYLYTGTSSNILQANGRSWNSGLYSQVPLFNFDEKAANPTDNWINVNTINRYSPFSSVLEEHNVVNIPSIKKFGYGNSIPYVVASNADYTSTQFESFENVYANNRLEDGLILPNIGTARTNVLAHSGKYAYQLSNGDQILSKPFQIAKKDSASGIAMKIWVHQLAPLASGPPLKGYLIEGNPTSFPAQSQALTLNKVAQTGEWSLYEARMGPSWPWWANPANSQSSVQLRLELNDPAGPDVLVDDWRIQPQEALLSCMVYDPTTLRLVTVLDDQHFATIYQYNAAGKLVRKIIETEKGYKTVQEQQYNLPFQNRSTIK